MRPVVVPLRPTVVTIFAGTLSLVAFFLTSACTTGPSRLATLEIEPAITSILVGQTVQLTAYETDKHGRHPATDLSWSSTDSHIASVDSQGNLSGIANGQVEVRVSAADGIAGAVSLRVFPDFSGAWHIAQTIVDCTRLSGEGPSSCRFDVGSHQRLELTLVQTGAEVDATGSLATKDAPIVLHGRIGDDGALLLTGRLDAHFEESYWLIGAWSNKISGATMPGESNFELHFSSAFGPQVNTYRASTTGTR